MNIKILDSWLREYLKTDAKSAELARQMSLSSVSIERIEKYGDDYIYDIEVTTNRPDLMSLAGLAREGAAVLPQAGFSAAFVEPHLKVPVIKDRLELEIVNDSKVVNRICAVLLQVKIAESPKEVSDRLETSGIRSINNVVDVTNYIMREIGHPMHAFDFDKLKTKKMLIRESKSGEKIKTLDGKEFELAGGDIVADDGTGEIIDLLGVMGTENSAVNESTTKVLLFVDNNDQWKIRKTSMNLLIRSEAAILNEKGIDPEKAYQAILRGIALLEKNADATVLSEVLDIYPNKPQTRAVKIQENKINSLMGIPVPIKTSEKILEDLGFKVSIKANVLEAEVPSWRLKDVEIPEDLAEEIARVYGYHKLPSILPPTEKVQAYHRASDQFFWEDKTRNALKYWGFTEVYTYPMVSEDLLEGPTREAVKIVNPLTSDHVYMRTTLVPSLLEAARENKTRESIKLFEISNVYLRQEKKLPEEKLKLAGVYKKEGGSFFDIKGVIEALFKDLGISHIEFTKTRSGAGASVHIRKDYLGEIEILEENLIDFELDFETVLKHASLSRVYNPVSKFPESTEDLRFEIDETVPYEKIVNTIKGQSDLIKSVSLLDVFKNKKTFRIIYQSRDRNLTSEDLTDIREKILSSLKKTFKAEHI